MFAIRKDMEFAMPPRGVTVHKTKSSGKEYQRLTWRCEVEGCWHVCYASDEAHLELQRGYHARGSFGSPCPSPPMRESLPSGLPEIEKLWREMDDITDALVEKAEYRNMSGDTLKAFAKGIAYCIVMKDKIYFATAQDVAREASERWKMRNNKAEYRKTPTSQNTNGSWMVAGGWSEKEHGSVERVRPVQNTPAQQKPKHKLTDVQVKSIKTAIGSGMFTADDMAETYGVSTEVIKEIVSEK